MSSACSPRDFDTTIFSSVATSFAFFPFLLILLFFCGVNRPNKETDSMAETPLESRDVSVTRDRPTLLMETTTGSAGPLRSTAGHPVPLADSFVFQPPRTTPGMSPTSFRHLKERSLRHVGKPAIPRERSASWGGYSVPLLSGIGPPLSPFRAMSSSMSSAANSPFMPILGGPPTPSMSKAAMEAALTSERVRMKEKELEEQDMSTEELKSVLRRERIRMSRMAGDLAVLRSNAVQSQAEAEVNEEGRINCLLAHLDGLQQEKGRIILELEREEEMVSGKCVHVHSRISYLCHLVRAIAPFSPCLAPTCRRHCLKLVPIVDEYVAKETERGEKRKGAVGTANRKGAKGPH